MDENERAILNQILNESDDDFDLNNLPTDLSFLNEEDRNPILSLSNNKNELISSNEFDLSNSIIKNDAKEDTPIINSNDEIITERPIHVSTTDILNEDPNFNNKIIDDKSYVNQEFETVKPSIPENETLEEKYEDTFINNNKETIGKEEFTVQDEKKQENNEDSNKDYVGNDINTRSNDPQTTPSKGGHPFSLLRILSVKQLNGVSKKISSAEFKKRYGFPTCIDVSSKYIAIGTSKGAIILFDHFQEIVFCIYDPNSDYGRLFSMSLSSDSEWILAGHNSGIIMLWDIKSKKLIKSYQNESKLPIIYVSFLDDKKSKFIASSLDGLVLTYSISKVIGLWISDTNIVMTKTQEWGNVLALAPLLPDKHKTHPIQQYSLLACATYNRVIVLSLKEISHNLYALRRPKSIGNECIPYLAWRPLASFYKDDGDYILYDPVLAIAWGPHVNLIHISFQQTEEEGLVPNFKIVASHKSNHNIIGIMWLDSSALVYITNKNEMKLFDPFENDVIEVYNKRPIELVHHNKLLDKDLNSLSSYHMSMCSYKGHLYTLGMNKVYSTNLLTWEERITYMTSKNGYIEAIGYLVDLIQRKSMVGVKLPRNPRKANLLLHQKMEELLNEYSLTSLSNRVDDNALNQVAIICLTCCFNIGRSDFIFSGLYPNFKKYGKEGLIFENIVPFIVGGKVYKLNADIIQQFLKFYENTDPRKIEDVIEYFDISLLDFHTIVKFSTKHLLAKPLLFIYIKALDDYVTPLELLLSVLMDDSIPEDKNEQKEVLPKDILNYMELIFNEKDYPSEEPLAHDKAVILRDKILDSFYYGDVKKILFLINYDCNRFLEVISVALDTMSANQQRLKDWVNMLLKIVYDQSNFASDDLSITQYQCALILIFVLRYLNLDNLDKDNVFDYKKIINLLEPYPKYLYEFLKVYIEFRKDKSDFTLDKETGEKILHLMCQYEPDKVFNWIQEFHLSYSIEKALEITSKYESTLGTYCRLLEKIGDFSHAIDTIVSLSLKKLSSYCDIVINQNEQSLLEEDFSPDNSSNILELKKLMLMAISLCKRNKEKIKESDFKNYLIKILDTYLILIYIVDSLLSNNKLDQSNEYKDHENFIKATKLMNSEKLKYMKAYLHKIISFVLENILGFVDVTFILNQITLRGTTYWSDFKSIFHMVIENLLYEESILKTASQLLKDDAMNSMQMLIKRAKTRIRSSNIEIE